MKRAENWITVGKMSEIEPDSASVRRAGTREIALIRTHEGVFALDNSCPHSGGPLGEGLVQENTVTCPLHGWKFECRTGKCLTSPGGDVTRYPVKIAAEEIWVELSDRSSNWLAVSEAKDLAPETARSVQAGAATIALVCSRAGIYALENACAHQGGPLGEGSVEGTTIACPLHGWKFDFTTGHCLTDSRYFQRTFEVKLEEGKVWVRVPAAAPPAREDALTRKSRVEIWKAAKHGIDVWPDILRYAQEGTPMSEIDEAELERMKWYGFFYRKNNDHNHYMCRIRVPGCELTSEQARTVAFIAYESGYSMVDVTTRGNFQIQGLTIEKLPGVLAALEKVGLTPRQSGHDNVRNITSHPLSGIDPEELIDTRSLARQIQAMIVGSREFSDLPRKFNIAMTGRKDPAAHAWTQDLCYVAAQGPGGKLGFRLLLGGNQGQAPRLAWHIPVFVFPEQVTDLTAAILRTFCELGYRHNRHEVRFCYLIERIGPERLLEEIESRLGWQLTPFTAPPELPSKDESFLGWFKQKQDDLWAVGVCIPVGRLTWDQLNGLGQIATRFGDSTLRTTYDQNVVIPGIASADRVEAGYALAHCGLSFESDPTTRNLVACTGRQFCNLAVTETKGYAYQLIETLRRRRVQLEGIRLHMSGCPSSCAMSYTADIGLKGTRVRRGTRVLDAFDVFLGGGLGREVRMGTLYERGVTFDQLPVLVEELIREFHLHRASGQSFSEYWSAKLRGHKVDLSQRELPTWSCSRCGHRHVAADPPPFCPVCSALRRCFVPASGEEETHPVEQSDVGSQSRASHRLAPTEQAGAGAPAAVSAQPRGRRILVIGGSIGGHTAAEVARSLDPNARITIVTDEKFSFYNRLNLTRFLAGEVQRAELFDYRPAWYQERQIEILTETRAIGLDPVNKVVLLEEGRELPYDACILAHGAGASAPPFYRAGVKGVHLLRTLADVEAIISETSPGTRAAVIGGGVLGLEAAYGLLTRGASVCVFECAKHLMPRQLDESGGAMLEAMLHEKGIECHAGVHVQELSGPERAKELILADGRRFDVDLVIVSTGIRPNIDWVKRSGIHCNRGILVDARMQTSAEGVYAVGDVVEWQGQVVGLWTNAIEQAKTAATNAAGKTAFFQGSLPVTVLKCVGIPLISMGEIKEDGDGVISKIKRDPARQIYQRIIFQGGIPIGGFLLGTAAGMGEMRRLIETGRELEHLRARVAPEEMPLVANA